MPLTRHKRRQLVQNASQPIYRLSPELVSEIFLQARPDVFTAPDGERNVWVMLVRYLVNITSVSCYFRQVALDFGVLWDVVGFSLLGWDSYQSALVAIEAFLERAQKRKTLHFYFDYGSPGLLPPWFHSKLFLLITPHARRVQTLHFRHSSDRFTMWDELQLLLNEVRNVKNLTVHFPPWMTSMQSPNGPTSLTHLRELSLTHVPYGRFYVPSTKQIESLELRFCHHQTLNIQPWICELPKLKRLILCDRPNLGLNTLPSLQLENLMYLEINTSIYPKIAAWLSPLQHRHLVVDVVDPLHFPTLEPQLYRHPSIRTLSIKVATVYFQEMVALLVTMNPQLEYLEFKWMVRGFPLLKLLSGLLKPTQPRGRTLPGEVPNFPGPSLKYLRLRVVADVEKALLGRQLKSILSRAPELRLDLICPAPEPDYLRRIMGRFPSRVRIYLEPYRGTPLDELYDELPRDSESE